MQYKTTTIDIGLFQDLSNVIGDNPIMLDMSQEAYSLLEEELNEEMVEDPEFSTYVCKDEEGRIYAVATDAVDFVASELTRDNIL